jgi:hypothetical protein
LGGNGKTVKAAAKSKGETLMGLPQAIKDQETKADQLVTQLAKGELVDVIVDDPSKAPAKSEGTPSPAPHPADKGDDDTLNQKYSVLQGKYNHETAELRRTTAELRRTLDQANTTIGRQNDMILDLHTRLNALEKGGGRTEGDLDQGDIGQPPAKAVAKGGPKKLNPADFDGYGSEMKDLVDGFNAILDENQQLRTTMTKAQESDADRSWTDFKSRMAQIIPDWEVLNYDQGFLNWLDGTDSELDSVARKQKLQVFVERMDANKCAKFFEIYKRTSGYKPGAAGATPSGPRKEDIVQPDASASGADAPIPGAGDKGEVTVEEYNQAVREYTQKRISYAELEKIQDAYQRGLAKKAGKK